MRVTVMALLSLGLSFTAAILPRSGEARATLGVLDPTRPFRYSAPPHGLLQQLRGLMIEAMLPLGLMVGWTTLLFWLTLPVIMALG
jgi:hypothetical protein